MSSPWRGAPRWTVENRQFVDSANPAISPAAETREFYFVPSSVSKSVCTFVRQLRGPHFQQLVWRCFTTQRTIEECAQCLQVSVDHLSATVKERKHIDGSHVVVSTYVRR